MIRGIDHIAIAVKDLDKAVNTFNKLLNMKPSIIEEVSEEGVKVAMYTLGGIRIELIAPLNEASPLTKFLNKRGEGIHHIALKVKGIEDVINSLKSVGFNVIYEKPKVVGKDKRKITFIHPKNLHGVLVELVER